MPDESTTGPFGLLDYAHRLSQSPLSNHTRHYQELFFASAAAFLLTFFKLGNPWEDKLLIFNVQLAPWIFLTLAIFWFFRFWLELSVDLGLRRIDRLYLSELFVAEARRQMKPLNDARNAFMTQLLEHMKKATENLEFEAARVAKIREISKGFEPEIEEAGKAIKAAAQEAANASDKAHCVERSIYSLRIEEARADNPERKRVLRKQIEVAHKLYGEAVNTFCVKSEALERSTNTLMASYHKRDEATKQYRSSSDLPYPGLSKEEPTFNADQDTARPILILSQMIQYSAKVVKYRDWVGAVADSLIPSAIMIALLICIANSHYDLPFLGWLKPASSVTAPTIKAP